MRSLCYECQVLFILKLELITKTNFSHLDSFSKRDLGELGNGLFDVGFLCVCPLIDDKLRHNIVKVAVEPGAA